MRYPTMSSNIQSGATPADWSSTLAELPTLTARSTKRKLRSSSRAAYDRDLELFARFGGRIPCSAKEIQAYIDKMRSKVAPATLHRRIHAIAHQHRALGHPSPIDENLRTVMRWLQHGKLPPRGKQAVPPLPPEDKKTGRTAKPMTRQLLSRILDAVLRSSLDRRDEALLLLGFMAGLKRGQLVALDVADLKWTNDALIVRIKAQTDEDGRQLAARTVALPITGAELCAASSVKRYVEHLALEPGQPLFVSYNRGSDPTNKRLAAAYVSEVLKRRMKVVGLDPTGYSGESLRRGRLLELAKGAPL